MADTSLSAEEFAAAFEDAFARLRERVSVACDREPRWPDCVAAAIRSAFEFAAEDTRVAQLLTREPLARGRDDEAHFERLVAYFAALLRRAQQSSSTDANVPAVAVEATVGGLALLVGHRLASDQPDELGAVAEETICIVLAPYLGLEEARRIASE